MSVQNKKKVIMGVGVAIGIILLCALCYFASVSASSGDSYNESNATGSTDTGSSDIEEMTARAQEESANVPEDEQKDFTEIDVDQYLEYYEDSENRLVLFASPTCSYCQIAEPILHHLAYQYDLTIYYVDASKMDEDDQANLLESNEFFEQFGTPSLLVVSNGEIVSSINGLVDTANYESFFTEHGFIEE